MANRVCECRVYRGGTAVDMSVLLLLHVVRLLAIPHLMQNIQTKFQAHILVLELINVTYICISICRFRTCLYSQCRKLTVDEADLHILGIICCVLVSIVCKC